VLSFLPFYSPLFGQLGSLATRHQGLGSYLAVWLCDLRKDAHNRPDQVEEPHVSGTAAAAAAAALSK